MEDTFQEGQEKEEEQEKGNIEAEDNAIEMSEDFDGQMHDGDDNEPGNLNCLWPHTADSFLGLFHFQLCLLTGGCYCWL